MKSTLIAFAVAVLALPAFAQDPGTTLREQRIVEVKKRCAAVADKQVVYQDCSPESPFLLCMEPSVSYNVALMLDAFKGAVNALHKLFSDRFGALYDDEILCKDEVCVVYIFENRVGYVEATKAPQWSGGHYDPANGTVYTYKDTSQLYETLFHEGTRQLIAALSQKKVKKLEDRRNTNMFWFTEGIATNFQNFRRDAKGGFEIDKVSSLYLPVAKKAIADGKALKLDALMKVSFTDFVAKKDDPKYTSTMTAQAWSVVYFLQTYKDGKYREKLDAYFKKEAEQKGGYEAAEECFGDLGALDAEYVEFIKELK